MQQAAITPRHENLQFFSDLYTSKEKHKKSDTFDGNDVSKYISYEYPTAKSAAPLNGWEFFRNELEYE